MRCPTAVRHLFAFATLAVPAAPGVAQHIARDIVPPGTVPQSSSPGNFVDLNGIAIFTAQTGHGIEPWRTDGTVAGTSPVKDINPGPASSNPLRLTVAGSYCFFTAQVPGQGTELWRTDGTAAGTILLADLVPGNGSGAPTSLTALGPHVYFTASDASGGAEPWRSDGTVAGTQRFVDIQPGANGSSPTSFTVAAGLLFFTANAPGSGRELWKTDGTVAGTVLVADLSPTTASTNFGTTVGTTAGLFFTAAISNAGTGLELCFSDGTAAGTGLVRDIRPGSASSNIQELTAFGSGALFVADDGSGTGPEPWFSDGTLAGTNPLGDLQPGAAGSAANGFAIASPARAVFAANSPANGIELWSTDGTAAGTTPIDLVPGPTSSSPAGIVATPIGAFFVGTEGTNGRELWRTDGTAAGTSLVADLSPGAANSSPSQMAWVIGRLLFRASSSLNPGVGFELYSSDGTAMGTGLVADIYPPQGDSNPAEFEPTANGVVFSASNGVVRGLWGSDGTTAGTIELSLGSGIASPDQLTVLGPLVYAAAQTSVGRELVVTDGTAAGTGLAVDINPGVASGNPLALSAAHGALWFRAASASAGYEPYVSDGSTATSLGDLYAGTVSSNAGPFAAVGPVVVFQASDAAHGKELFVSDGTAAGTGLLLDIDPGTAWSSPDDFLGAGTVAYFTASNAAAGRELWRTDGTAAGTTLVADLAPGSATSNPGRPVQLANGTVIFTASVPGLGVRLHRTDGTAAGTVALPPIGTGNPLIMDLVAVGNLAFCSANDQVHGRELWVTDGFTVSLVADVYPGAPDGVLAGTLAARPAQGQVVFAGSDGSAGLQVWVSDGTAPGTTQVGKIGPWAGVGAVELSAFRAIGNEVWFLCDDGISGREPWVISITGPIAATSSYGTGCAASGSAVPQISGVGLPTIGNTGFGIAVGSGPPLSVAVLAAGFAATNIPLGTCHVLVLPPIVLLPTVFLDPTGAGATPLSIPNDPSLAGTLLYGQYLVIDATGPFLGFASLSDGLAMLIGN
ncbi:MAG TPA: ELWxxDGT repeat protein [Planctomycetota bacterium]|nr:ELWxxDGT repeat protein [Planctomycetota bacterium]